MINLKQDVHETLYIEDNIRKRTNRSFNEEKNYFQTKNKYMLC